MYQSVPLEHTVLSDPPHPEMVRALLLDDSSFDRARIRRLSRKTAMPVELDEVGSIEELNRAVVAEKYDLIMIDYRLPVGDGMEALDNILQNPQNCDAAKIMITGDGAVDTAVRAMRGGCHDFLTKAEMDVEMLNKAMNNAMTLARERQMMQFNHQRDVIRHGLVAALNDREVQGNVISLMRQHFQAAMPERPKLRAGLSEGELDALLVGFSDEDEFHFH